MSADVHASDAPHLTDPSRPDAAERRKADLLASAAAVAEGRPVGDRVPAARLAGLLTTYYRHVAPEDVESRRPEDLYGALASQLALARTRPQGTAQVRTLTPTPAEHGWSSGGHSVVEVVTDDMPFLVDSVVMELSRQQRDVHVVVHPQFEVERRVTGELVGLVEAEEGIPDEEAYADPAPTPTGTIRSRESWMHVEVDRFADEAEAHAVAEAVRRVLRDVRDATEDADRMAVRVGDLVTEVDAALAGVQGAVDFGPVDAEELRQGRDLLRWLADDHFTFLGYREYDLEEDHAAGGEPDGEPRLRLTVVPGTGLGILRGEPPVDEQRPLPAAVAALAREPRLLVLTKANSRATVHRPAYLDYVGVKKFRDGRVVGERRFLGLFTPIAHTERLTRVPVLREKALAVLDRVGFDVRSHAGKAMLETLANYPREELFQSSVDEITPIAQAVMYTRERRALRVFVRRETYGRYLSVMVYLPRDRYNTAVRERFQAVIAERLGCPTPDFNVRLAESTLARVHLVARPEPGQVLPEVDAAATAELEHRLAEVARSWADDLLAATVGELGEAEGTRLGRAYATAFPEAYKEDFDARTGAVDLARLEALRLDADGQGLDLSLVQPVDAAPGEARLKIYRVGRPLSLSHVLPMLSSTGAEVVDERPYELDGLPRRSMVYDFGLRYAGPLPEGARTLLQDTVRAVWDGLNEVDGFNTLVLAAGLTWRQATVLRAYAKYMKQGGAPYGTDSIEECLRVNPRITRLLSDLFEARFDPRHGAADSPERAAATDAVDTELLAALDAVVSLDHDRILRSYRTHVLATLRTNRFQQPTTIATRSYLSFKLEPARIPDLPAPRPRFEIFVYSPRVEGVHLRFGAVARGGLRWSDRRDDFRTEVLGLVKAQMVKNTVIVPVGAKGGFYAKQLPVVDPADPATREAWLAEGQASYRTFISGLLDVTDNLVDGPDGRTVVPPDDVVRHDGDDTYLVVAADKGTATFSDLANSVAQAYGFWLGDAFASGGSVGYDHKAMGITARGAWVSVRRHFRERGIDCQREDFTCVGIGDMSGDVFGNGMLCSEHTRLVAAFDHRDIVLDPTPDAARSYAERARLFALPRSSWQDYDTSLLSAGGGVFSRSAKAVPVSPQARAALGIDTVPDAGPDADLAMTPAELMRAILLAPVDLLWNGGIGTYVKAAHESHADAGDKANDAIRVDGGQLRAACVGEGGNLGLTQAGRIEYAQLGVGGAGGRINTDFIDNSAGVDTSDHEVNIKILLDRVVAAGDLTRKQRDELLGSMTDEVAALVLRDNDEQNLALANAVQNAPWLLHVHEDWMRRLERRGVLDRALEGLPSTKEVRRRLEHGGALTTPELSVLMAWTKIVLADELVDSDLPDDPFLAEDLVGYFPTAMRATYADAMRAHPLRREIVVTQVVNDLVNGAGMTYWPRLAQETGAGAAELVRANFVAREIFGSLPLREEVRAWDNRLDAALQTRMRIEMRTLVERASRWLVTTRRPPLDSRALVDLFAAPVQAVMAELPALLTGREAEAYETRRDELVAAGVPDDLASRVAVLAPAYALLGVVETAEREGLDPVDVARVHFALGERLGLPALVARVVALPRADRWQNQARASLRDDLHGTHAQLTARVLASTSPEESAPARVASWEESEQELVDRAVATLEEIVGGTSGETPDLARVSVGLRVVRSLLG